MHDTSATGRARQTITALRDVWGTELPPGPDPTLTVMTDAVAFDDDHGRNLALVVQGDQLPLTAVLALVVGVGTVADRLAVLPPALHARVAPLVVDVSRRSSGQHPARQDAPLHQG